MQPRSILRLKDILGDPYSEPPKPPLIPVSRATWYRGMHEGLYPKSVVISRGLVGWLKADIDDLLERFTNEAKGLNQSIGEGESGPSEEFHHGPQ